jgi:hypothetical protein
VHARVAPCCCGQAGQSQPRPKASGPPPTSREDLNKKRTAGHLLYVQLTIRKKTRYLQLCHSFVTSAV